MPPPCHSNVQLITWRISSADLGWRNSNGVLKLTLSLALALVLCPVFSKHSLRSHCNRTKQKRAAALATDREQQPSHPSLGGWARCLCETGPRPIYGFHSIQHSCLCVAQTAEASRSALDRLVSREVPVTWFGLANQARSAGSGVLLKLGLRIG